MCSAEIDEKGELRSFFFLVENATESAWKNLKWKIFEENNIHEN